ncbi:MAG: type IV pilus twitching motility protein PilT [Kofleriaceae bacterium]
MSTQLANLLAYFDREGVQEIVICTGRPIAVRQDRKYQPVTQADVTRDQLARLMHGTEVARLLDTPDGEVRQMTLAGRPLRVAIMRHGADLLVRIEPSTAPAATAASAVPAPATTARTPSGATSPSSMVSATQQASGSRAKAPAVETPTELELEPETIRRAPVADAAPPPEVASGAPPALIDESSSITRAMAAVINAAQAQLASDLHISANRATMIRTTGELRPLDPAAPILSIADVEALVMPLLGPRRAQQLQHRGYVDLAVEVAGVGRLRGNVSRHQGGLKAAFRIPMSRPPSLDELGLPRDLAKVVSHHQGLVVIAGPSGHGKTTTLAALVDVVNSSKPYHILTIEDPVEIEHPRKAAVVSQREVGRHTASFVSALKASLREDPDVIVIGELRDRETVEIALTAAETGHLVIATMSTPSAAKTIDRLIDMFPPDDQSQVRVSLAGALRAIVAQRLIPSASGNGVVAAVELLTGVLPLATLIRDNKLFQLPSLQQRGRAFGMIRLEESLLELVRAGKITEAAALAAADSRKDLSAALRASAGPATPSTPAAKPKLGGLFGKRE